MQPNYSSLLNHLTIAFPTISFARNALRPIPRSGITENRPLIIQHRHHKIEDAIPAFLVIDLQVPARNLPYILPAVCLSPQILRMPHPSPHCRTTLPLPWRHSCWATANGMELHERAMRGNWNSKSGVWCSRLRLQKTANYDGVE